jgi:hypothetical protein
MNNFLDDLRNLETGDDSDNFQLIKVIRDAANNLGDNARRMLEIGHCQDFLMDNEFDIDNIAKWELYTEDGTTSVEFNFDIIEICDINGEIFKFDPESKTLYADFIAKIKEIINHD